MKRNPRKYQKGKRKNDLLLSLAHQGGTVNPSQGGSRPGLGNPIRYVVDHRTLESFSPEKIRRGSMEFLLYTAASVILLLVTVVVDLTSLYRVGSFNLNWVLCPTILACVCMAIYKIQYNACKGIMRRGGEEVSIGHQFFRKRADGHCYMYDKVAFCQYSGCEGEIVLRPAPPRVVEKSNRELVGICTVAGKQHTYTYDRNGYGTAEQFDWRPLKKKGRRESSGG